ncbi:thioesterase family protein [uncultured Rikenella sp.]|uniref:thioesterase family protein n=1 Tax=uncultured Rikenella sp. TaxID=368003 RepID=UPI0026387B3B|nr:thioesterase family protein [uncultured Rikenella sp.]
MREIIAGTSHTASLTVAEAHTAVALGSGDLPVLGTPALAALMENAAMKAIAPFLDRTPEAMSSVGIALNISHERASSIGEQIRATATVTAVDGRRVDFDIQASDSSGRIIGRGTHTRFIVNTEKFMAKIR